MSGRNLLFVLSDEHSRKWLGAYGNGIVSTPNLDKLAGKATVFSSAYCASPICVPARAALATGRHLHEIGYWDNADAYDGRVPSWHHVLRDRGHRVVSIGKLHFKSSECDTGFSEQILPMHVPDGLGDLQGLLRDEVFERSGAYKMAAMAGPGESDYTRYDQRITEAAIRWIKSEGLRRARKPWALFLSFVAPHFPLTAPPDFYDLYPPDALPMPKLYDPAQRPRHPHLRFYASNLDYDRYFQDDRDVRRALAGYLGLCSYVDHNIGRVLGALEETRLLAETGVIYTSDHGDNLGARGIWGKSTMYEEAVGVPLIVACGDQSRGSRCDTPVSHLDLYPLILEHFGIEADAPATGTGGGISPLSAGSLSALEERGTLAQYHATGSSTGIFMLRWMQWKLIHHVDQAPELFDLSEDPEELRDLAAEPRHQSILKMLHERLRQVCDPLDADRRARRRQRQLVEQYGGRSAILARGDIGYSPAPAERRP